MDRLLGPRRRRAPQPEPVEAASRVAAERHLTARLERLRAYAATLEAAAASRPPDARLAGLERQLTHAQRVLRTAERPRLPPPAAPSARPAADGPAATAPPARRVPPAR